MDKIIMPIVFEMRSKRIQKSIMSNKKKKAKDIFKNKSSHTNKITRSSQITPPKDANPS